MSTGSLSDTEDAPETSFAHLDSPSEDDFNDDGLDSKPRRANMRKRGKSPKDGRQSQRHAANARERARMRVLAKAFSRLKTSLPWVPADTKLSKLDTLRLASNYINHLRQLLHEDKYEKTLVHPVNLVKQRPKNRIPCQLSTRGKLQLMKKAQDESAYHRAVVAFRGFRKTR